MDKYKNLKASFIRDIKELDTEHQCDKLEVFYNAVAEYMIDKITTVVSNEVDNQFAMVPMLREKFQREVIISMVQGSALSNRDLKHVSRSVWEASGSMARSMYPPSESEAKAASDRTKE